MSTSTAPTALTAPTDTFARIADYAVAKDRDDLAAMSDRELLDIGLSRGSTDVAASGGWSRDTYA